jgi:asparagine synthase (glutamine-hydrolysing)
MCGIAGLIERSGAPASGLEERARAMASVLAHRGPDGSGLWSDAEAGVALSHRRLAIIDLTETGAQPMISADARWVISYNGEIYNARDIAREPELSGVNFRGTSDTEVILESVARRGLDRTLDGLNGMYALALWDRQTRTLHLVRDRIGIKPLFYSAQGSSVCFASELNGLMAGGGVRRDIDSGSVASFLRFGYVPAPWSIFKNVAKVMPGELVSFGPDGQVRRRYYWSLSQVALDGSRNRLHLSDDQAEAELAALLSDAVSRQMISDVPLGAFLSGGIDSSTIVALMVAAARGPVRTFSIGFPDFGYDESYYAAAVARHLGTEHTELKIGGAEALAVVPRLADIYDEPFADSSQIPTYLVSKLTRQHVTVALSGDGGDELFAGYNRYIFAERLWGSLSRLPLGLRRAAASALNAVPGTLIDRMSHIIPRRMRPLQASDKLKKLAGILPSDAEGIYLRLVSQCPDPAALVLGGSEHPLFPEYRNLQGLDGFLERMQLIDAATYLPDDILQKVDRASMAVSLEARPPFLDHRVVEFSWKLPRRLRIRGRESKWLLRRVLDRYVPRALVERPKMGFGVPLADWLRGPLRDWAEDILEPSRFGGGQLDVAAARRLWTEHLDHRRNWSYALWTLLMFESWRRRWAAA